VFILSFLYVVIYCNYWK